MSERSGLAAVWQELERIQQQWIPRPGENARYTDTGGWARRMGVHAMDSIADPWRRVQRVQQALEISGPIARRLIVERLVGIDLSSIWTVLLDACKEIALYYGSSVVVGAVIGGVAGAFAGGVGAVPGAAGGAALGAQVGGWILAFLGLKSLIEYVTEALPEALKHYENGFRRAWGAPPPNNRMPYTGPTIPVNVSGAASDFALGHVIVIMAMLSALVSYLTRGRGNKAQVLQEIRQSPRLGPKVADWIAHNEGRLLNHPSLQHKPGSGRDRKQDVGSAESPSSLAGRRGKGDGDDTPTPPPRMPEKKVPCFKTNDLPAAKVPEFDRQLAGQQRGLNDMTVEDYLKGRKGFDSGEIVRDPAVAKQARDDLRAKLIEDAEQQLARENPRWSVDQIQTKAATMAKDKMSTLAALHNPDMKASGKDVIADFGDRNVNSRIGAQWRSRVEELDAAAERVPAGSRANTKMNAKLERCK